MGTCSCCGRKTGWWALLRGLWRLYRAKPAWAHHAGGNHVHVWPLDDLIDHDTNDHTGGCPCGPTVEPTPRDDGSCGWVIAHHSLDGRERAEPDA